MSGSRGPSPLETVVAVVADIAQKPAGGIQPELRLKEDLGIDSLDFVRVVQEIEDASGVTLPDVAAASATRVADLVAVLAEAVAAQRP